jgi:hypothetical protein
MSTLVRLLRPPIDAALAKFGLAVVRRSNLDRLRSDLDQFYASQQPPFDSSVIPPGADIDLRPDHPRLVEYGTRYRGHPAAIHSQWSDSFVQSKLELRYFRGDTAYIWQRATTPAQYGLTAYYAREDDPLKLFERLNEDGLFGALTYDVDGLLVSRDLLDSIAELTFLEEELKISQRRRFTILDIGAGYGRLAHRATTAFPNVSCLCTDAVPVSSFICEYYLRFRGATDAKVVPLDEVEAALERERVDLAVNVHSFSECPMDSIGWWLDVLCAHDIPFLAVVPNTGAELLSTEREGPRRDFLPLIESRGFELIVKRPKYARSKFVQKHGLYPSWYFLFSRSGT